MISDLAMLYRWEGEQVTGERDSGPPSDQFRAVMTAFNLHRHDLPLSLQKQLDDAENVDPSDTYSIGEHYLVVWRPGVLGRRFLGWHALGGVMAATANPVC